MRKTNISLRFLLLLIIPFLFSSCFEIIEDVTINTNGSGKIALTVNLSQSRTKLKTIMLMDSINGYKIPSETDIRKEFNHTVAILKGVNGLSNVKQSLNFDNFIFKITCDFNDLNDLNKVVETFSEMNHMHVPKGVKHFSFNKNTSTFSRNYEYNISKSYNSVNKKDREAFENAAYVTIYRFQKPISAYKNKKAKLAKNNKAIMLKVSAQELINNTNTIKNKITIQK